MRWLLLFTLWISVSATAEWTISNDAIYFTKPNGALIHGNTADGADTGALAIGAGGLPSSKRGAVVNLYGEQHPTWPGELFLTPVTDNALGRINLESITQIRKGLTVNARWWLVPGGYDATAVPDPDGPLHVFGDYGALNTDTPQLPGFIAQTNANLAVFEQRGASNGITIATPEDQIGRLVFADPDNAGVGQIAYNHGDDTFRFNIGNMEAMRATSDIWMIGKQSSNVNLPGVELNRLGMIQATGDSALAARFNRLISNGDIVEFRKDGVIIGTLFINSTGRFGIRYGSNGPIDTSGTGTPEGLIAAPVGSTYRRTDGGLGATFYVKESGVGSTGWVAK